MIKVTVKINGIEYNLKGREDENYLKEVAEYVDSKINEIKTKNALLSTVDSGVLAALNIADELYKADLEIEDFKKKSESLKEKNLELREEMSEQIKALEELRKEVDEIKEDKEKTLKDFNDKIKILQDEIKALIEEKNVLAIENNDIKKESNIVKNLNNKLNEEIVQVNNLSEILNKEIVEVKEKNINLKNNINKYIDNEKGYKSKIEDLNKEISGLNEREKENNINENILKEELDKEIIELKDELELKSNELSEAIEKAKKLSYEKQKIMESSKDSRQELKTNKYKVLDLEKKLMDAQIEIAKLKKARNPLIK